MALLNPNQVSALGALGGLVISPDMPVVATMAGAPQTAAGRAPAAVFPERTGATVLAADGDTGAGETVAVLDTGIDPLPDFGNRLIGGVDLTGGGNPFNDQYGHGTFVAGLIAGNGASSGGQYIGEAPGANLVSIKVAGANGATDEGTVIEGIAWAIAHRATYGINVLNMSLGAAEVEPDAFNPLDQAAEAAWAAGIVVVASAGNLGNASGTITSPGDDPLVITAGAVDDNGTPAQTSGSIPSFSSVGPTAMDGLPKPDLVASGRSVVSLLAPGSTVATTYPSAQIGTGNFVGSGTSFSAAITSGAAALVLAANPTATPNQVKARLLFSATPGPVGNPFVDGHGELDAYAAATGPSVALLQYPSALSFATSISMGTVWAASSWDPANWVVPAGTAAPWSGTSWNGTSWNGTSWNGTSWNGTSWNGTSWNGTSWNGTSWNGTSWNGTSWN